MEGANAPFSCHWKDDSRRHTAENRRQRADGSRDGIGGTLAPRPDVREQEATLFAPARKGLESQRSQGLELDTQQARDADADDRRPARIRMTMRRYDETVRRRDDDARIDSWATSCQVPSTLGWALSHRAPQSESRSSPPLGQLRWPVSIALCDRLMLHSCPRRVSALSCLPLPLSPLATYCRTGLGTARVEVTTVCQIPPCPDLSCHRDPLHVTPCPCHHALTHL